MGMMVTAKGVCDEPTLHMLQELDCDAVTFLQWNDPLPSEGLGSLDCDVFQAVLGVAGEPADRDKLQRSPVVGDPRMPELTPEFGSAPRCADPSVH
jgi:hypothetical protein